MQEPIALKGLHPSHRGPCEMLVQDGGIGEQWALRKRQRRAGRIKGVRVAGPVDRPAADRALLNELVAV